MKPWIPVAWVASIALALAVGWYAGAPSGPSIRTAAAMRAAVSDALQVEDPLQRASRLAPVIEQIDSRNLPGAIEAFDAGLADAGNVDVRMFTAAWAKLDALGMLSHVNSDWTARRHQWNAYYEAIYHFASQGDLATARQLLGRLPGGQGMYVVSGLVRGAMDAGDRRGLIELLTTVGGDPLLSASDMFAAVLYRQGGVEALDHWLAMTGRQSKRQVFNAVLSLLARVDPQQALEWAEQNADPAYSMQAQQVVARRWVEIDPQSALAWITSLPEGADRNGAIEEAADQWVELDVVSAARWLETQQSAPPLDPALRVVARYFVNEDPQAALEWAERITHESNRNVTLREIGRDWIKVDPEAARAWLEASGLPEDEKKRVRRSDVRKRAQKDLAPLDL